MDLKRMTFSVAVTIAAVCGMQSLTACGGNTKPETEQTSGRRAQVERKGVKTGGPQLGTPGGGPVIDKSSDAVLQAMIRTEVPEFEQCIYSDPKSGKTLKYNLYSPKDSVEGASYPLVLFMADASTPGDNFTTPLTQGYGALVWATAEWQKIHPCYVLVPQYSGVAVNDAYEHTDEVDMVIGMLGDIVSEKNVDASRLYTTGQSMGGMISMYYNITYPDLFAASLFVDCHWDTAKFDDLVKHKFTFVTAGKNGSSYGNIEALERAADAAGVKYEYDSWSAKLPQPEQDALAKIMLDKGAPINIINFSPKSVLPDDGKGSEHMYSFDYAYKLSPVRDWLFEQHK